MNIASAKELASWVRRTRASGEIDLVPPHGTGESCVTIRDRVRPFTPLHELLGAAVSASPLTTAEGEHGELATVEASGVERTVAVIWGDDFQTVIEGRASRPDERAGIRAMVRDLAWQLPLGLGVQRVRRYRYRAPAGWRAVATGLVTDWFPPDLEIDAAIKVLPARPLHEAANASLLASVLHDARFATFVHEKPLARAAFTCGAFTGLVARAVGRFPGEPRRVLVTAGFTDKHFRYAARLDCLEPLAAAYAHVLHELVASCEPIALPIGHGPDCDVMSHWAE